MSIEGVDYAWQHPSPAALVAAGKRFACRYLSHDPGKNLSAAEAQRLHAAGIAVVSNWEATSTGPRGGSNQGVADARDAAAQHAAFGGPADRPIYFSVDWNVQPHELPAVDAYFRGVASVLGLARTGAYGGEYVIAHLFDTHLIRWGWQTYAWSGGWDGRAQLQQYRNGVRLGGADVDLDRATTVDYGQWPIMSTEGLDMATVDAVYALLLQVDERIGSWAGGLDKRPSNGEPQWPVAELKTITPALAELKAAIASLTAVPTPITDEQLKAALLDPDVQAMLRAAVKAGVLAATDDNPAT